MGVVAVAVVVSLVVEHLSDINLQSTKYGKYGLFLLNLLEACKRFQEKSYSHKYSYKKPQFQKNAHTCWYVY